VPDDYKSSLTYEVFSAGGIEIEFPPMAENREMLISHLPALRSSRTVRLMENTQVRRVVCAASGHVTALEARGPDGEPLEIAAKCFVLGCGGVETPRLLLGSRSARFPDGVGNDHDLVGRYFMEHLWAPLGHARVRARALRPSEMTMEALTWEFYERLAGKGLGGAHVECLAGLPDGVRVAGLWEMAPQRDNRVVLDMDHRDAFGDPTARVEVTLSEMDRRTQEELVSIAKTIFARLGAGEVATEMVPPQWCHHHMGTCRMGVDPRTSVVDSRLRVHGTDNLYLVGSSVFCSGGAGPPTLLLTALALRLADHLRESLRR
jgi:choline dehydrogenase-like flavoprotein